MASSTFADVEAGRASILLFIQDRTSQGLAVAHRRLRRFTNNANAIGARAGAGLFGRNFLQSPLLQLRRMERSFGRVGRTFGVFSNRLLRTSSGLGSAFGGIFAGLLLTRPLRDFSTLEQLLGRFRAVFRGLNQDASTFVDTLSLQINQSPIQLRDIASQFQAVFQGIGFDPTASFDLTKEFTRAAQDLIAFDDTISGVQEAVDKLLGGLTGSNIRGVRRFGADVTEANIALALQSGLLGDLSSRTEQQNKLLARRLIISESLQRSGVTGQAVREVRTLASALRAVSGEALLASGIIGQSLGNAVSSVTLALIDQIRSFRLWSQENQGLTAVLYSSVAALGAFGIGLAGLSISTFLIGASISQLSRFFGLLTIPIRLVVSLAAALGASLAGLGRVAVTVARGGLSVLIESLSLLGNTLRIAFSGGVFLSLQLARTFVFAARAAATLAVSIGRLASLLTLAFTAPGEFAVIAFNTLLRVTESIEIAVQRVTSFFSILIEQALRWVSVFDTALIQIINLSFTLGGSFSSIAANLAVTLTTLATLLAPVVVVIGLIGAAAGFLISLGASVINVFIQVGRAAVNAGGAIAAFGANAFDNFSAGLAGVADFASGTFSRISESFEATVFKLIEDGKIFTQDIGRALETGNIGLAFDVVVANLKIKWEELTTFFLGVWNELGPRLQAVFTVVIRNIGNAWSGLVDAIGASFTALIDSIQESTVLTVLVTSGQTAAAVTEATFNAVRSGIASLSETSRAAFNEAFEKSRQVQDISAQIAAEEEIIRAAQRDGNLQRIQAAENRKRDAEIQLEEARDAIDGLLSRQEPNVAPPEQRAPIPEAPAAPNTRPIRPDQSTFFGGGTPLAQLVAPSVSVLAKLVEKQEDTTEAVGDVATILRAQTAAVYQ